MKAKPTCPHCGDAINPAGKIEIIEKVRVLIVFCETCGKILSCFRAEL